MVVSSIYQRQNWISILSCGMKGWKTRSLSFCVSGSKMVCVCVCLIFTKGSISCTGFMMQHLSHSLPLLPIAFFHGSSFLWRQSSFSFTSATEAAAGNEERVLPGCRVIKANVKDFKAQEFFFHPSHWRGTVCKALVHFQTLSSLFLSLSDSLWELLLCYHLHICYFSLCLLSLSVHYYSSLNDIGVFLLHSWPCFTWCNPFCSSRGPEIVDQCLLMLEKKASSVGTSYANICNTQTSLMIIYCDMSAQRDRAGGTGERTERITKCREQKRKWNERKFNLDSVCYSDHKSISAAASRIRGERVENHIRVTCTEWEKNWKWSRKADPLFLTLSSCKAHGLC